MCSGAAHWRVGLGVSDKSLLLSTHSHVGQLESWRAAGSSASDDSAATGIVGAAGCCYLARYSFEAQTTIQCRSAGVSLYRCCLACP